MYPSDSCLYLWHKHDSLSESAQQKNTCFTAWLHAAEFWCYEGYIKAQRSTNNLDNTVINCHRSCQLPKKNTLRWFSLLTDKGFDDLAMIITITLLKDVRGQVSPGREIPTVSSPLSFISLSLSNQLLLLILLYSSLAAIVNKHI